MSVTSLLKQGESPDRVDALLSVMTAEEVAKLLRVNRKTIYDAVRAGSIPFVRVGRLIRFRRDVVLGWAGGQGCVSHPRSKT